MPESTQRCCRNPRGGSDGAEHLPGGRQVSSQKVGCGNLKRTNPTGWISFCKHSQSSCFSDTSKSYVWSSLGVTALAFLTGAVAFWMPNFLSRAHVYQQLRKPCSDDPCNSTDRYSVTFDLPQPSQRCCILTTPCALLCFLYSYIFGAVTVATGILGGALGTGLSRRFRDKIPNADPLICAVGMLGSVPCLFITIFVASTSITATYVSQTSVFGSFVKYDFSSGCNI